MGSVEECVKSSMLMNLIHLNQARLFGEPIVPIKQEQGDDYILSSTTMEVEVKKIETEDGTTISLEFKTPDEQEYNLLRDFVSVSRPDHTGVGFDRESEKATIATYDMGWDIDDEVPEDSIQTELREEMHNEIKAVLDE